MSTDCDSDIQMQEDGDVIVLNKKRKKKNEKVVTQSTASSAHDEESAVLPSDGQEEDESAALGNDTNIDVDIGGVNLDGNNKLDAKSSKPEPVVSKATAADNEQEMGNEVVANDEAITACDLKEDKSESVIGLADDSHHKEGNEDGSALEPVEQQQQQQPADDEQEMDNEVVAPKEDKSESVIGFADDSHHKEGNEDGSAPEPVEQQQQQQPADDEQEMDNKVVANEAITACDLKEDKSESVIGLADDSHHKEGNEDGSALEPVEQQQQQQPADDEQEMDNEVVAPKEDKSESVIGFADDSHHKEGNEDGSAPEPVEQQQQQQPADDEQEMDNKVVANEAITACDLKEDKSESVIGLADDSHHKEGNEDGSAPEPVEQQQQQQPADDEQEMDNKVVANEAITACDLKEDKSESVIGLADDSHHKEGNEDGSAPEPVEQQQQPADDEQEMDNEVVANDEAITACDLKEDKSESLINNISVTSITDNYVNGSQSEVLGNEIENNTPFETFSDPLITEKCLESVAEVQQQQSADSENSFSAKSNNIKQFNEMINQISDNDNHDQYSEIIRFLKTISLGQSNLLVSFMKALFPKERIGFDKIDALSSRYVKTKRAVKRLDDLDGTVIKVFADYFEEIKTTIEKELENIEGNNLFEACNSYESILGIVGNICKEENESGKWYTIFGKLFAKNSPAKNLLNTTKTMFSNRIKPYLKHCIEYRTTDDDISKLNRLKIISEQHNLVDLTFNDVEKAHTKREQAVQLFINGEINYKSFKKAVTDPTLSQYIDIIRPHLERKLRLRIEEAMKNYDCESCNPKNWDLPSQSEENLKEFIEMAEGLLVKATTTMNNDGIYAASEFRKQLEDIKKNRNIDNLHKLIQQLCNPTKISNAPDLLKQLCDDSFTYVSSNILSEPQKEVPDTYPADLFVLEGILNCVPSESHNSELYKKLLAHSISCVEKLKNMFLTKIEDVAEQGPTDVIKQYSQIENIKKIVDEILKSSKFHKVEFHKVLKRIENLNKTLKSSIRSRVKSHMTKKITTKKAEDLNTYKKFSISLGWVFDPSFEDVTQCESERKENVKKFLETYTEHELGSSSEPAKEAFTGDVLKQYLLDIFPKLGNSAEQFLKNWIEHPSSSVSALVSFKKSWNDFMPVVEGFDAPKKQQDEVKKIISSWVTTADKHFKIHSGNLSKKLQSYNNGPSDISESDCNAVHELIPFLKDYLLSGGLDTVSRVEEELDTALLKFKKLNEACVTACQKLPDKTLLESINAIQNNDKSIKVFYGSRLRDRMSDFAWLPHSNATQQLKETVKGLGDGIDSALLKIKKRWTETNKGGHEYYIDVWNSLTSIRCVVDSNNDTLTGKTSAIKSYFKELKNTTNLVITGIVKEVSENHVVVGDEENQKKLISTFAPLGTLLKFHDDAVPSDVQIDDNMKTIIAVIAAGKRECLKTLSDGIVKQTSEWVKTFDKCKERESAAKTLALRLLTLQVLGDQISVTESIAGVFSELRQSTESSTTSTLSSLSMVRDYLTDINTDDTLASYVKGLQNDHGSVFQAVLTQDRNNKTKHMTIEKALNLLFEDTKNSPVNKQLLEKMYTTFEVNWKQGVKSVKVESGKVDDLKDFVKKVQDDEIKVTNENVLKLCTSLFTLWSIRSTDTAVLKGSGRESAIVTPNVLQVLAVFRMLGFDIKTSDPETYLSHEYNIDNLKHHFLEILTGEGKSIVIAIAAAVLAILGNTVHCMCYSDYLCKRDYEEFRRLFDELCIGARITWDTYENHCERILSGSSCMRMRLACAITKGAAPESVSGDRITSGKTIAIIDEMDTLWNFENYANEYVALETLKLESLTALAELIWKESRSQESLFDYQTMIFEADEYKKCVGEISKYNPRWEKLMMSCVRLMLKDVLTYKEESYFFGIDPESGEKRICYEDNHGKSYTKRHSYKTMWHAFAAHSEGSISTEERNHYIVLNIIGAKIAYARIVEAYDVVLALTGTLSSMHKSEIGLIEETLKDVHKSFMPSAFRNEHKQINVPTVQVTDTGGDANKMEFHGAIIDFILQQTTSEDPKRPICILFDKDSDRRDFQNCSRIDELNSRKFDHNTLNDNSTIGDSQNSEINSQHPGINKIPKMNTLSTMTHPFSRGIDPKTTDVRVPRVNGVLLIQTYLSPTEADEAQARGRVGRQGEPGSWALIFDVNSLRKGNHFNMSEDEINQLKAAGKTSNDESRINEVRKAIKTIRDTHHDKKFSDAIKDVERTTSHHDKGKNFIKNLKELEKIPPDSEQHTAQVEKIQDYILNMNKCIIKTNANKKPFRLMLCIDATESMRPVFDAVRETLDQLICGIGLILEMQGIERGFEINIVGYRNYDKDADHLITISGWKDSSDSDKLKDFLKGIRIESGNPDFRRYRQGEEAIEVALAYANEEFEKEKDSCGAVMIIGDAPPLPKHKVKDMREKNMGEAYWKKERSFMRYCTDFEAEVQKLVSRNIPVHTNALHKINALKEPYNDFQKIAKDTGGKYTLLDFNTSEKPGVSEEAFEKLAKDIATNIAKRILEGMGVGDVMSPGEAKGGVGYVDPRSV